MGVAQASRTPLSDGWEAMSGQQVAQTMIAELNGKRIWPSPLVTEVIAAPVFCPAEAYTTITLQSTRSRAIASL